MKNLQVIHRDLKLDNIVLNNADILQSTAKLCDFGLARFVHQAKHEKYSEVEVEMAKPEKEWSTLLRSQSRQLDRLIGTMKMEHTKTFKPMGSLHESEGEMTAAAGSYGFMAPEVFKGEQYNERADIFSFAVVMYNLCYRIMPSLIIMGNGGASSMALYARKVACDGFRQPLNDEKVPQCVNDIIRESWDEDPESRPSASSIVERLEAILQDPEFGMLPPSTFPSCCTIC